METDTTSGLFRLLVVYNTMRGSDPIVRIKNREGKPYLEFVELTLRK